MEPCSDCQALIPTQRYDENKGLCDDCFDSWIYDDDYYGDDE
jgi:hypothetical protein